MAQGPGSTAKSSKAKALILVLLLFPGVPCILLHGKRVAIFRGSVGRLRGRAWGDLCNEPCEVLDFQAPEQMWRLRLRGSKRHGEVVLADEQTGASASKDPDASDSSGFLVDYCLLPAAIHASNLNSYARPTTTAMAGKALEATTDVPRGATILQELPFMVACDRSDLLGSRARAFLHMLEEAQAGGEDAGSLRQAFEELTTGGLEEKCMQDATPLSVLLSATGCDSRTAAQRMAAALARWQCNCQRLSVPPASGLYRLHSGLQHSCAPNCAVGVLFSTGEVLVRALRDIRQGELLTRNYEQETFLDLPLPERQQHLLQTRGFRCLCQRCATEGGSKTSEYGGRMMKQVLLLHDGLFRAAMCRVLGSALRSCSCLLAHKCF